MTVSGDDRPGVSSALFDHRGRGLEVLDVEQVVVRGHLTLALLLAPSEGHHDRLEQAVAAVAPVPPPRRPLRVGNR